MKHINSRNNSFYKELRKLAGSARQRVKEGLTLLDGTHLLASYLESGGLPLHLLVTQAALSSPEVSALINKLPDVPLTLLEDALFGELSELKSVSGLISLIKVQEVSVNPRDSRFCLLLENIQDPGNLGSMLRSAAAAGCDAVFMSAGCADAWSPRVLRAAMGGHFVLTLHEHADLPAVADVFPGKIFAAALSGSGRLYDHDFSENTAFIIGNEGAGITQGLLARAISVTIPMLGKVESLNAAAAAAICLFEAVRQRS